MFSPVSKPLLILINLINDQTEVAAKGGTPY